MNRAREYMNFAGWFAGLGYIAMWPLTVEELSGKPFGAAIFCRDSSLSVMDLLCNSAHPLRLPAALHALGCASVLYVATCLLVYAFKRARRARGVVEGAAPVAKAPVAVPRRRSQPAPPPLRDIKPRAHFGLRGQPN